MDVRMEVMEDRELESRAAPELPCALHSIMQVLQPAKPPEPRNARVIRRFDLDVARPEPAPVAARASTAAAVAAPAPLHTPVRAVESPAQCVVRAPRRPLRKRALARANRNKSLLTAAGLA